MIINDIPLNPAALEAAARALVGITFSADAGVEELKDSRWRAFEGDARAAVFAYLASLPVEYAGLHKHAGLETEDQDGGPFESEEHLRENYVDFPNCTLMHRPVIEWQELDK